MTCGIYYYWDKKKDILVYIGKSVNIERRHKEHYRESQKHVQQINKVIQNSPERYEFGLLLCCSEHDLNQYEIECIKFYKPIFNFTDGGDGLISQNHPSKRVDVRKKLSLAQKKRYKDPDEKIKTSISSQKYWSHPLNRLKQSQKQKERWEEDDKNRKLFQDIFKGQGNPNAKYTLWDITVCEYRKSEFKKNNGYNPRRCFLCKYNTFILKIGYHLDFTSCDIINQLIKEELSE